MQAAINFIRQQRFRTFASAAGGGQSQSLGHGLPSYQLARLSLEEAVALGSRFPWKDEFELRKDLILNADTITETLRPLFTQDRLDRIDVVAANRTFNVLPIVQHPYDMGNLAAICRSADALGFGAVHVIRNQEDQRYKQSSRTSGGSDKWLDLQLYSTSLECIKHAKSLGYRIVATHMRNGSLTPDAVDWTQPTAVVFGNELDGVSEDVLSMADDCIAVPMDGFVESFNVSVAAALVLWEARRIRKERLGANGDLSPEQRHIWKAMMLLRAKGVARQMVSHLLRREPPNWQRHRNKGQWYGKIFSPELHDGQLSTAASTPVKNQNDVGVDPSAGLTDLKERRKKPCNFWDGTVCWGERVLYPYRRCRYHGAHIPSMNTLNERKLKELCGKIGVEMPDVTAELHDTELDEDVEDRNEALTALCTQADCMGT